MRNTIKSKRWNHQSEFISLKRKVNAKWNIEIFRDHPCCEWNERSTHLSEGERLAGAERADDDHRRPRNVSVRRDGQHGPLLLVVQPAAHLAIGAAEPTPSKHTNTKNPINNQWTASKSTGPKKSTVSATGTTLQRVYYLIF